MKKMISIISSVNALICAGGISFLSSCGKKQETLTPQVREIRQMNPNVPNITVGDFRLQILDDYTVRFEYKYQNPIYGTYDWLDDDTLFVPNRTLYKGPSNYSVTQAGNNTVVTFGEITIKIPNNIKSDMKGITVYKEGITDPIYNSDDQINDNTGNLPAPEETEEVFEFVDYPRIIEPILGYSEDNAKIEPYKSYWNKGLKENCGFEIQKQKDIYLTFPDKDAKKLRQQYRNLAGAPEMVRLSTLGAWDSRYYPYNEQTAQEEVDHYYENDLPLDNLVIDTDWRAGFDGKGYFVNESLFPNMPRFLKSIHDQNINVCFNDHPEPQKDDQDNELPVLDPKEVQFRRYNLDKILSMGLDTWWYDRNWSTSLICPGGKSDENEAMLNHETWGDYLYNNVTKQQHITHVNDKYDDYGSYSYRRPTTMSNVVQIRNGEWKEGEGFTDSAAHRYSMQWTGDQHPSMLPSEVVNVVRTGNNSMPYMSSDLAGHNEAVASDYYYQRWMEYGALSPIFRIHCTRDLEQHCQPWYRPDNVIETFRNWIKLRYRLLPLYYSLAREAYDTGMPICRAVGFHYDVPAKYRENQYLIGSNILFAPCTQPDVDTIDGDSWVTWDSDLSVQLFNGRNPEGTPEKSTTETDFSAFADMRQYGRDHEVGNDGTEFSAKITGTFTPSENRCVWLKSDDGCKFTITDQSGTEIASASDWRSHSATYVKTDVELVAGTKYNIEISYFNGTEGGSLAFAGTKKQLLTQETKKVYIPDGKWLDLFHGDIFVMDGERSIICKPDENALFVKLGTIVPLIDNAQNTSELDWTNLAYDVYPIKDTVEFKSSLYEDDFETVGYQDGHYRTSDYSCEFTGAGCTITLDAPKGSYIGDDAVANRTYKIRFHKIPEIEIASIIVDGSPIGEWQEIKKSDSVKIPFNFSGASKTEDVYEIEIPMSSVQQRHIIQFVYE